MKKITVLCLSLLTITTLVLASCSAESTIKGLWQNTKEPGTIEFKANGEVIIVDNMSVTVTGSYEIVNDNLITFRFTATDILRDSIQPIPEEVVTAKIIKFNGYELQLKFSENAEIENYKRVP